MITRQANRKPKNQATSAKKFGTHMAWHKHEITLKNSSKAQNFSRAKHHINPRKKWKQKTDIDTQNSSDNLQYTRTWEFHF